MTGETTDKNRQALRDRLRALITSEFEEIASDDVAAVLSELSAELQAAPSDSQSSLMLEATSDDGSADEASLGETSEEGAKSSWTNSITSRISQAVVPAQTTQSVGEYRVLLRAKEPADVATMLHQALQVGALLIAFDMPPQLNDLVAVDIELPQSHLSVETQGRVVHSSASGTAVEVSQLKREDRAALETILDDHRSHLKSSAGPAALEPSEESHADTQESDAEPIEQDDGVQTTMQGRPQLRVSRRVSSDSNTEEQDANALKHHHRPGSSVVLGALIPKKGRADFSVRREVELTDPDMQVLTSPKRALRDDPWAGKTFGPEASWIEPAVGPDRVETLAGERMVDVLLQLSGSGFTGVLELEDDDGARQVYFDGGLTVDVNRKPRSPREELGLMLHMADRIDDQQLAMAAAHAEENDTTFERSLLELEILDHDRIRHAIAGRLTYLTRQMCETKEGNVRVYSGDNLPAGYLPAPPLRVHVPVERIIYKRLFERLKLLESDERDELVADHLDAYPEVAPTDRDRLDRVVLNEDHGRLIERIISGRRRLREVFTESNLSPAETFAAVYALHRMGVLRFDTSLHQTIVRERFRENVTVKYLSVHKASYFEVLNVHWSSYDDVIKKAFGELTGQFDPDEVPESMEDEVHDRVGEIRQRIERAYEVLAGREQRHAYRKRIMPEYKLAHAIPLFMKQSELAERRSQWTEALDSIQRVLEIDPDNEKARVRRDRIEELRDGRLSQNASESSF